MTNNLIMVVLTSLISSHSQQQQVPNSRGYNTPHSGVGAIPNAGDNTPWNGVTPGNQMTGLVNGGVGIYHKVIMLQWKLHLVVEQQAMVMVVKVMVLKHLMVIILHQKELHLIGVREQAIIHFTMVLGYQIQMIVPSLFRCEICFYATDDGKHP